MTDLFLIGSNGFRKTKDFLLCIDSDGCAFDTMNAKHKDCFAPMAITVFNIKEHTEDLKQLWSDVNLYSATRGLNRFKGIGIFIQKAVALNALQLSKKEDEALKQYLQWTETTQSLSNDSLKDFISKTENHLAEKILNWSCLSSEKISALTYEQKKVFKSVEPALKKAQSYCDIAVVSSAPSMEIFSEWKNADLLDYIGNIFGQEAGSKTTVLANLTPLGYKPNNCLFLGDALSDLTAAKKNNYLFYPVIPDFEDECWQLLESAYLEKFLNNSYAGESEQALIQKLHKRLPQKTFL